MSTSNVVSIFVETKEFYLSFETRFMAEVQKIIFKICRPLLLWVKQCLVGNLCMM